MQDWRIKRAMVWWIAGTESVCPLGPTCSVSYHKSWHYCSHKNDPGTLSISITTFCVSDPFYTAFPHNFVPATKLFNNNFHHFNKLMLVPLPLIYFSILITKIMAPCLLWKPILLFLSLTHTVLFHHLKPLTFRCKMNASVVWCWWHSYLPMWWMAVITCRRN